MCRSHARCCRKSSRPPSKAVPSAAAPLSRRRRCRARKETRCAAPGTTRPSRPTSSGRAFRPRIRRSPARRRQTGIRHPTAGIRKSAPVRRLSAEESLQHPSSAFPHEKDRCSSHKDRGRAFPRGSGTRHMTDLSTPRGRVPSPCARPLDPPSRPYCPSQPPKGAVRRRT